MFTDMLKVPKTDLQVDDLRLNPGNASPEKVQGFPPTVFGVAGMDPLRDEGLLFAMTLAEASVPTDVNIFPGLPHGFRRYGDSLSECERWDKVMENGTMWVLSGPVASPFLIRSE
jgi:acetyl esterase/lipase